MPALGQFITTAAALVSLLTVAGLALQRGIVVGLRERVGDQEGRIKELKEERAEDQAEITRQQQTIASLEEKVHTLGSLVTGEVYLKALTDLVEHLTKLEAERWRELSPAISEIRETVTEVAASLRRLRESLD